MNTIYFYIYLVTIITITVYGNETGGSQTIPVTVTYVQ